MGAYDGLGRALANLRQALEDGMDDQLAAILADNGPELKAPVYYKRASAGVEWPPLGAKIPSVWVALDQGTGLDSAYWGALSEPRFVVAVLFAGSSEDDATERALAYHHAVTRTIDAAVGPAPQVLIPGAWSIVCDTIPLIAELQGPEERHYWRFVQTRITVGIEIPRAEAS